jgi:hypothetical protein
MTRHGRAMFAVRRRAMTGMAAAAALVGVLMVPVAFAAPLNDVLAPKATASSLQEYRALMTSTWQYYFEAPAPGPKACTTATIGGERVSLVTNFRSGNSSCTVSANQPIYVNEYTNMCSTIPGEHNGFGTAPVDIRNCTYTISHVLISVWLDKHNIGNVFGRSFWVGTPAFPVTLAAGRFEGVSDRNVTAAVWGWTLLLKKLPKGKHTLKCRVLWGTGPNPRKLKAQSIITLHVR